ncbi:peptide deformylase [Beduini massiliensis]|uniref:peptide deformylase n=1 Tax=Beduini massiliensis TaxID=1585974 RepID=UPI00059A7A58|nr:peptide deformylase [Beduini massiliensis]
MIREIIKDPLLLNKKSTDATYEDRWIAQDLLDTLNAHHEHCVGMAANMIGELKNIIIIADQSGPFVMYNPQIIKTTGFPYTIQEGCLSHQGTKETLRYPQIKVAYLDDAFKKKIKTFYDYTAQIIQHEIDHCNGILI